MKKFALFSDICFAFFVSGIFSAIFFKALRLSTATALLLALLCGILTALSVGAFLLYRRKNVHLKHTDEAEKEKLLFHLSLLSDEAKTTLFQSLLSSPEHPCKRFGRLRLFTDTDFYFLKFSFSPVSADEIATLSRLKTGKRKTLFCNAIDETARMLCGRLSIAVKTGDEVYALFKNANALPKAYLGESTPSSNKKRRLHLYFSKKNARRFVTGGAMLLLFARLSPYAFYYIAVGIVLLLSAVFIRIFGYE